jgi:hypothetical protein
MSFVSFFLDGGGLAQASPVAVLLKLSPAVLLTLSTGGLAQAPLIAGRPWKLSSSFRRPSALALSSSASPVLLVFCFFGSFLLVNNHHLLFPTQNKDAGPSDFQ